MKFIHITDTHLLKDGEFFHGFDTQKRFELCIRSIRENHSDAHCIVVTGDLTERGEPEAYQHFHDQIAPVGLPVYCILGNHDNRENFNLQFPAMSQDPKGFVQAAVETPKGVFLFLDTKLDGSDAGTYCEARCDWLLQQLAHYRAVPVFLFMHHAPFDINLAAADRIGLDSKEAFASAVATHDNVRHIFFGHAHRPLSGNWKGVSFSSMSGTNHQSPLDFKDTGTIGLGDMAEYAIVFIDDDQLVVHTHNYLKDYS